MIVLCTLINTEGIGSQTGPGCSKLTTLLVNVSLKFQTLISNIHQYFCWKNVRSFCSAKASLIFSARNISVFGYKMVKHLMSWSLNELIKLTMLWTTGPRTLITKFLYLLVNGSVGTTLTSGRRVFYSPPPPPPPPPQPQPLFRFPPNIGYTQQLISLVPK